jgi:hypothetical protein
MDGTVTVARRNGDGTVTERSRKRFRNERFTVYGALKCSIVLYGQLRNKKPKERVTTRPF